MKRALLAAELHSNALRLSIEWSRVFPSSTIGVSDLRSVASPAALAYYHAVFAAMKAHGMRPLVTLNHYAQSDRRVREARAIVQLHGWQRVGAQARSCAPSMRRERKVARQVIPMDTWFSNSFARGHMNRILFVSLAFAFTACGHPGTALDHNRAGSGSGMLQVTAEVDASNDSNNPMTNFQVDLADGIGNPVSGAIVTVHNGDFQDVALVEASAGSGHYVNSRAALSGADFGLDVSHPTKGSVTGVVVGNPGMQLIKAPSAGAIVSASAPMAISWTTPIVSQSASVETRDFAQTLVPDTGTYTIPGASNPASTNQTLKVRRYNTVNIAGGIIGSQMSVTSKASVSYVVR